MRRAEDRIRAKFERNAAHSCSYRGRESALKTGVLSTSPHPLADTPGRQAQPAHSDAASLLIGVPSYQVYTGGVSNLPALNGLADDRIGIDLNGLLITSACANHMNASGLGKWPIWRSAVFARQYPRGKQREASRTAREFGLVIRYVS